MLVAISLIRNPGSSEHAAVAVSLMGLATKLLIRLNEDSNSMVALESHRRLLVTLLLIALGKSTSEEPVLSFESKVRTSYERRGKVLSFSFNRTLHMV